MTNFINCAESCTMLKTPLVRTNTWDARQTNLAHEKDLRDASSSYAAACLVFKW